MDFEDTLMRLWLVIAIVELVIMKTVGLAVIIRCALRLEKTAKVRAEWTPKAEGSNGITKLRGGGF